MTRPAADDDARPGREPLNTTQASNTSGVPRIVVTGSESSGKTTLAEGVARALHAIWVPEFSRDYAERVRRVLTEQDVEPIARGQLTAEDAAIAAWRDQYDSVKHRPPLVLDTDLVSTTVYAEHYYGDCPAWIAAAALVRLGDVYLLCEPDLSCEADGVRGRPAERRQLHDAFRSRLRELRAHVFPVSGQGPAQLQAALGALRDAGVA